MKNLFQPPICAFKDNENQSKFNLTWYIGIVLMIYLSLITVLHYESSFKDLIFGILGVILAIVCLMIMLFTGKYKTVAKLVVIFGSLLLQYSVFALINPDRIIDLIWIFCYTLFAFYTLSKYWGLAILTLNFIGIMLYQFILPDTSKFHIPISQVIFSGQVDYFINITFGTFAFGFILLKVTRET